MDFLDNLLLGKNTPKFGDESTFPSKTYKKNLCRKKHCDKFCLKDSGGDWEFWTLVLSCKPLDRSEIGNRIINMKGCIRFSVWYRMCADYQNSLQNEKQDESRSLLQNDTQDESKTFSQNEKQGESKTFIQNDTQDESKKLLQNTNQRDKDILKLILKKFRYKQIDEEELFDMVINTLNDHSINTSSFLDFIFNILDLPYADLIYLKKIMSLMNNKLKLYEIFKPVNDREQSDNNLIEYLVQKNFMFFCRIIDLILCYQNTTFKEAISFFKGDNVDEFESLMTVQNLNNLKDFLRNKKSTLEEVETIKSTEPTYYDFLVVQNETIRAQEHIKEEYIAKITELENNNKELKSSLEHFKEVSSSLEEELNDYQDGYVKEISRLLDDTKKENDVLQKEILKLKDELCRIKRNIK